MKETIPPFVLEYGDAPRLKEFIFGFQGEIDYIRVVKQRKVIIMEKLSNQEALAWVKSREWANEGNEIMGLASDVTPIGDYDPVKDRTNYVTDKPIAYSKADPGRFFLYFPKDMHQPSVKGEGEAVPSRKIVGKIEYV